MTRSAAETGANTLLEADLDGDRSADFAVVLAGVAGLSAGHLML